MQTQKDLKTINRHDQIYILNGQNSKQKRGFCHLMVQVAVRLPGPRSGGMIFYGHILVPDLVSEFVHIKSCLQV